MNFSYASKPIKRYNEEGRTKSVVRSDSAMLKHLQVYSPNISKANMTAWEEYRAKYPTGYARMLRYFGKSSYPALQV